MDIVLDAFGFGEFTDAIENMAFRALHPNRAFDSIIGDFHRREERAFGGDPKLERTGTTKKSLTRSKYKARVGTGRQGAVVRMSPDQLQMGTNVWYTRFHGDELLKPVATGRRVAEDWVLTLVQWIRTGEVPALTLGMSGQLRSVVGL